MYSFSVLVGTIIQGMTMTGLDRDKEYLNVILNRILVCKAYKPNFGQGQGKGGLTLNDFQHLYHSDSFYSWFGLDHPLMYAAHKAAGGITSVYRQIGIGCEQLFRQIIRDQLGLTLTQSNWSYTLPVTSSKLRTLSLDARISTYDVVPEQQKATFLAWLNTASELVNLAPEITKVLNGAVFEVRQGYKSKDSKRQNADIANAATAYTQGYLPVLVVLSSQIDNDIVLRYQASRWLILRGYIGGTATHSTYTFAHEILGYDLAGFFERNSLTIRATVLEVLEALLKA